MAITITINGSVTFDESAGLQNSGVAGSGEDNNDNDVPLSDLQTQAPTLYTRLFTTLGLSTSFPSANGIGKSADNYISLSGTGAINSLGFTDASNNALPVLGSGTGAACNLTALDGGTITLFRDAVLGSRLVYGVDSDGDIVFALFMDPNAGLTSAKVWIVQFEALANGDVNNFDDPLTLSGLKVGAGVSTEFNFDGLPSGQNLFGMVGTTTSALIVVGKNPVLNPDGTFTNASNTINTSKGGGATTIGVNNQMFDPGEGAYFTFVKHAVSNFLGTNLDANEADDADNMQYTDGDAATNDTIESNGAFLKIAQLQGGGLATMKLSAFNITGSPQEEALIAASGQNPVAIARVKVYNAAGTLIEDTGGPQNAAAVVVTFNGGVVTISGLDAGYKVEWFTANESIKFDQVLVEGVAGKFDIGGFGVNEPTAVSTPLTGLRFEDSGPSVDVALKPGAELTVDESTLPVSDSILVGDLLQTNSVNYGTDGAGANASVYALTLGSTVSGLTDTLTLDPVVLSINGDGTKITGSVNGGADVVFEITIDKDTGEVSVTQYRAMVNGDPGDPDEADTPNTLDPGTVGIKRTVADGDGDHASDEADISSIFNFRDDGPTLPPVGQPDSILGTDDTDLTPDSATISTDILFPGAPDYGNDGPNAVEPLIYALRLATANAASGLIDTETGDVIRLVKVGDDIVGYVDDNGDGSIGAGETKEAIRYHLAPDDADTKIVEFTQSRAVYHDTANPEQVFANLVFVDRTAVDGDGDVSQVRSFDLGAISFIEDDEPSIGPIDDGLVDFAKDDFVQKSLNGDVGNDPNASPYILTSYTASLTINDVELHGILAGDAKSVTYWADTGGNGTYGDAGDTAYYKLELGDQAGPGNYKFTVLVNPPPALSEFDFSDLPSGQNLFGCIADDKADLDGFALFVISKNADVNNPGDGQMTNTSGTVNTSKGGGPVTIGDSNQMYDPGEGAYFVYLDNPINSMVAGVPGGLTQTSADDADTIGFAGTIEARSASVEIVQVQGGSLASMNIKAFDIDMAPFGAGGVNTSAEARNFAEDPEATDDPVNITAIRVYNGATLLESWADTNLDGIYELQNIPGPDNHPQVNVVFHETSPGSGTYYATVSGVNAGYKIEFDTETDHDMTLVEGVSGKYDIGGFNVVQSFDTPDQLLEFTARVTDGDGDIDSASWKVGVDGTGVFDDDQVAGLSII